MLPPRPPLPHLPMAERCKEQLYLRAQFNMPDFAETTPGWIDRACHCFTGSHRGRVCSSVRLGFDGDGATGGDHTVRICHSGFHAPPCVPRAPRH